jgi:hypothetical protein
VRSSDSGKPAMPINAATVAMTAIPSHGSTHPVSRQRPSIAAMPPPTVNARVTPALMTVPAIPSRALATV